MRPAPDAQLQAVLAEVARARAAGLAVAAQELADLTPGDQAVRSAYTARLPELVREVMEAAVAYDRSAGLTWEGIGEWLELHPDTARSRYGAPGKS
ncbi:hypothetical protein OG413_46820 [Streptomyces sp. NBC_01433]|uniref:hypothetical protein n=1 Tax=Streptomyces sp. NBC_01433 TaxID=2903864 RepID=UPI00224E8AEE|nr:hypothetical protein [Streptomyces sp. NBC_01433]MCX4682662.1 hypothetical protein [Streptomyces sp. NBC_01433]MCX4682702.1 hypothetical protein [Streptomyces sp. NBC_01433]